MAAIAERLAVHEDGFTPNSRSAVRLPVLSAGLPSSNSTCPGCGRVGRHGAPLHVEEDGQPTSSAPRRPQGKQEIYAR